jgi:hypothetical protein
MLLLELVGILAKPRFGHSGRDDRSRVRQDGRTGYYGKDYVAEIPIAPILTVRISSRNGILRAPSTHRFWNARDGALADRSSR